MVAVGVTTEGDRQVLGIDVGPSEDRAFWTAFLRSLVKRGLTGVRLVISDAHEGLKQAIGTVLTGSTWQRCRVHFMRNLLATVPQGAREAIAAIVRTIFAQPDHASAMAQLRKVADGLRTRFPRAATVLEEAGEDILAYRHLPVEHQRQLHSTDVIDKPFLIAALWSPRGAAGERSACVAASARHSWRTRALRAQAWRVPGHAIA